MKKKVLVTGGAGCIGIAVTKQLIKANYSPIIYDLSEKFIQLSKYNINIKNKIIGSILDKSRLTESMKSCHAVVHLAAHLGVQRTENFPERCLEININGTKNVIEAAISNNIKKFIFASSSEVYGEPIEKIVSERSITQGKTVYSISKLAAEEYLKAACLNSRNKFKAITLRYFNTFGPYQIGAFAIPKFIKNVSEGKDIIVNGSGDQLRSYCYVEDTAKGTVLALNHLYKTSKRYDYFNIGNPSNKINIKDLAKKIKSLNHANKKISKIIYDKKFINS
ncbi:NAD-dependent epimerase/dehydratase family protein, partial [Alphaproteobacteria bacterium]|nr:NAD-dependent epimerase/dehydratase family protein [Alphaproteobacteria bacterium]